MGGNLTCPKHPGVEHAPREARKRQKYCPGGPKMSPRALKMSPGGPKMRPRGAKSGQSASKVDFFPIFFHSGGFWNRFWPQLGRLETAKRRPKRPQRRPREGQGLPKRGPRGSKKGPKCGPRGIQAKHRKNLGFFSYPPWCGRYRGTPKI